MRWLRNSWWMLLGCCGFIGLLWTGAAQAAVCPAGTGILPTTQTGTVKVLLYKQDGVGGYECVTDTYLPRVGEVVYVRMSNGTQPTLVPHWGVPPLLPPATLAQLNPYLENLTTSAYQGQATNYPSSTVPPPVALTIDDDFSCVDEMVSFDGLNAYKCTALDYGGMLVVQAGGVKFIIPKDSNTDGIPDSWLNSYLATLPTTPVNCQVREADCDSGPGGNPGQGDGISNFDEYRGFVVSGQHVRTDPRVKNLLVHLVTSQCTGGSSQLGGTNLVPIDILFDNANTLITGTTVSVLGVTDGASVNNTNEWVNHFVSYSESTKTNTYASGTDGTVSDRRVNLNAVYPLSDSITGLYIQKGLRVTECLDGTLASTIANTVMGSAGFGSANGPDNALIYPNRIISWVNDKCSGSCATSPKISTYVNGAWAAAVDTNLINIYRKMIQYVVAMEIGHSVRLTPTVEGTRNTSYGYHHAPGTGTNMDAQANFKSPKFSIPSLFSTPDQSAFKVRN